MRVPAGGQSGKATFLLLLIANPYSAPISLRLQTITGTAMTVQEQNGVRLIKSVDQLWSDAQSILQTKLKKPTFQSWIKPARLISVDDTEAVLAVNNEFMRTMVQERLPDITQALSTAAGQPLRVKVVIETPSGSAADTYVPTLGSIAAVAAAPAFAVSEPEALAPYAVPPMNPPSGAQQLNARANLNGKYTFDTFVVGSHNHLCHSAALAVAKSPGQAYNPLFLYGGVGLGKTHLMQAIGHEILRHSPHLSVRYLSCEKFTNELVNAIGEHRMIEFRKRYRQVDVLLVDDIQFIEGKEATQEEFFHTFNALRESGRQIVLSSDRPPKSLSKLEERLRSRFEWGLIADIQSPSFETRLAILRKKRDLDGMKLSDDVLEHIASMFTTNIRELEGALIRANAFSSLTGTPMTVSCLNSVLHPGGDIAKAKKVVTIEQLLDTVAAQYRVEASQIRSAKRTHDLSLPRHIAMYLAHEELQMSFARIGEYFGNRKHTSVMYAYDSVKEKLHTDPSVKDALIQIRRQLGC